MSPFPDIVSLAIMILILTLIETCVCSQDHVAAFFPLLDPLKRLIGLLLLHLVMLFLS